MRNDEFILLQTGLMSAVPLVSVRCMLLVGNNRSLDDARVFPVGWNT